MINILRQRDPDAAMANVYAKLSELGIEALGSGGHSSEPSKVELVEDLKREAELIRASWCNPVEINP